MVRAAQQSRAVGNLTVHTSEDWGLKITLYLSISLQIQRRVLRGFEHEPEAAEGREQVALRLDLVGHRAGVELPGRLLLGLHPGRERVPARLQVREQPLVGQ